jgi:5-methylcytosine-specific restriction endonuclease McrA
MTADHVIPRSRGGCNELENLQTLCITCNFKKDNKLEEECCELNLNIINKK